MRGPPFNFSQVVEGLYRSGQPEFGDWDWLRTRRIERVLSLNESQDEDAMRLGMVVVHCHIIDGQQRGGTQSDTFDGRILEVLDSVLDGMLAGGSSVLVHCTGGVDRTGIVIARWRARHGHTKDEAYADWVAKGSHRYAGLEKAWREWQP